MPSSHTGRSWEPYLTERDRRHLESSSWIKQAYFGFGEKPALVIIDDYYSVLGLEREDIFESIKKWPMSCGLEGWEAIDKTVPLLRAARANGIPVCFIHGLETFTGRGRGQVKTMPPNLTPEEWAMGNVIPEEIAPLPGEMVIKKAAASAFQGTPLVFWLNNLSVDTVICCGETTSGCVRASVVDATTYRYHVGVVEECTFDRTEGAHYINLFDMHQKYADVVRLHEAITYFDSIGAKSGRLALAGA